MAKFIPALSAETVEADLAAMVCLLRTKSKNRLASERSSLAQKIWKLRARVRKYQQTKILEQQVLTICRYRQKIINDCQTKLESFKSEVLTTSHGVLSELVGEALQKNKEALVALIKRSISEIELPSSAVLRLNPEDLDRTRSCFEQLNMTTNSSEKIQPGCFEIISGNSRILFDPVR